MLTLMLLIPLVAFLIALNFLIGCYVAIRLGFGPPNWQTAFNLVIPLTTFQNYLNEGRRWLEAKVPRVEQLFERLHVPRPIIFIDITAVDEEDEETADDVPAEPTDESSETPADEVPAESESPVSGDAGSADVPEGEAVASSEKSQVQ